MTNNFKGRETLRNAKTIPSALEIIIKENMSDLDVRCSLSVGTSKYKVSEYYKILSNILPFSQTPHLTPAEILDIIRKKNSNPTNSDEKSVIQHFLGGTDKQINKILKIKNTLIFIAEPIVHQILKGNYELKTQQMIEIMKENYLVGIQNNLFENDTLKNFNVNLFVTVLQRVATSRDKSYSGTMPNLGLTEQEATEFCVKCVLQECGVFNIVPQSDTTPEM